MLLRRARRRRVITSVRCWARAIAALSSRTDSAAPGPAAGDFAAADSGEAGAVAEGEDGAGGLDGASDCGGMADSVSGVGRWATR
ncbi:hypothetical protein GCM10010440_49360 [Kitasatospora cinereorecta]